LVRDSATIGVARSSPLAGLPSFSDQPKKFFPKNLRNAKSLQN
jgi:hypothetical protein